MTTQNTLGFLQAVGRQPATAHEIGANCGAMLSLVHKGLVSASRQKWQPHIYSLTDKGQQLVDLLTRPAQPTAYVGKVRSIQGDVAKFYAIPVEEMWSNRRFRDVARPRQVAMYFTREITPLSLPCIGRRFGGRDHTTVIHAINKVELLIASDPAFAAEIVALRKILVR
jgi:hypothetical protein